MELGLLWSCPSPQIMRTMVCKQVEAAAFNKCVNRIQDEIHGNLRVLCGELGKGKSSQKVDKDLQELKDLTAFQQNVNFILGKSMQHMADTIFVQAANMTVWRRYSYLEYLKPVVKPDTWCSLRNSPLHHLALFPNVAIAKAEVDISG